MPKPGIHTVENIIEGFMAEKPYLEDISWCGKNWMLLTGKSKSMK